jgi:hypothetical protein
LTNTTLRDAVIERLLSQFIQRDTSEPTNVQKLFEDIYTGLDSVYNFVLELSAGRYLDTAEGVWLDYIGDLVGVTRKYKELDPEVTFTFKSSGEASTTSKGFYYPSGPTFGGYMQSADGLTEMQVGISTDKETDEEYRKKIKARAVANGASGTVQELYRHILDGFGVQCKIDSPTPGLILITVFDFLSKMDRKYIEKQGPLAAGVRAEIINWTYNE